MRCVLPSQGGSRPLAQALGISSSGLPDGDSVPRAHLPLPRLLAAHPAAGDPLHLAACLQLSRPKDSMSARFCPDCKRTAASSRGPSKSSAREDDYSVLLARWFRLPGPFVRCCPQTQGIRF